MIMGYKRSMIKGIGWLGAFRLSARFIGFFKVILAYRFLSPRDIGLFGLAAIALGLLEMMTETGVNVIIVKEKKPLTYFIDTAFIVSIVRGLLIAAVLFISAFFLPSFFRDQALFPLMLMVSVIPIIRGFINPAVAQYQKDLKFSRDALLRLSSLVADAVFSIVLMWQFRNVTSLIVGMMCSAVFEVVVSYVFVHPWPKLKFNMAVAKTILNPGKWVNIAGIITYCEQNFDNILVGRMLGSTALGFYQTAFNLSRALIAEVGLTFSQVLLPIYSKIDGERGRLTKAVKLVILPAALLMLLPLIMLNIPFLQNLLLLFLKEKWRPMVPLLPWLTFGAWFTGLDMVFHPLFLVRNRYRALVTLYGSSLLSLMVLLIVLIPVDGLQGAAKAVLISRLLLQPFFLFMANKSLKGEKL